jgi:hypothetical protein
MTLPFCSLLFEHRYDISLDPAVFEGYGGRWSRVVLPTDDNGGSVRLTCAVLPRQSPAWLGLFRGSYPEPPAMSAVFASPNPERFLAIAGGTGYLVNASDPTDYEVSGSGPITGALAIPDHDLLVVADFTRVSAYGPEGLVWVTPDLSWDGLVLEEVRDGSLRGKGWNAPQQKSIEFEIDIHTGKSLGGSAPPSHPRAVP